MDMMKLRGSIQEYAWGDISFIPTLLHKKEDNREKAELWMGIHPNGMNTLLETGEALDHFIDSHREEILGPIHAKRFGKRFPFLFKVLSVRAPLSLQVHPDAVTAEEGFRKEQESDSEVGNYADPYQKDEVIFALDEVTALAGFRPVEEALSILSEIVGDDSDALDSCESIEQLFSTLLHLSDADRKIFLRNLSDYVKHDNQRIDSPFLSARQIAKRLLELYPEDITVYAPFILRLIHLRPGEALHVSPGMLHSYVCGHALEIMSSSDNVLRGGLTPKHVDVQEFLSILNCIPFDGRKTKQKRISDTSTVLNVESREFSLMLTESGESSFTGRDAVEIALVVEGDGIYRYEGKDLRVTRGDIILIPASISTYELTLKGMIATASVGKEEEV